MEDKLRHLKKHMDETVLKDIDFGESEKENVRKAIHTQARGSSRPWIYQMKNGLGVAVCLLLLFGGLVYALGQQGAIDKLSQAGSPSNQSKDNGNVSTYSAPVQKKKYPSLRKGNANDSKATLPVDQNKVLLVRMMGDIGWKLTRNNLYRTTDGGKHWDTVRLSGGNFHFGQGAFFLNSEIAWVTAYFENGESVIYHTTNGGDQWSVPANSFHGSGMFDFINQQDGWILQTGKSDDSEKIFRTQDAGDRWIPVAEAGKNLPADGRITGIGFNRDNPDIGWATGYYPNKVGQTFLYRTTDGGTDWKPFDLSPPPSSLTGLRFKTFPPMFFGKGTLLPVTLTDPDTGEITQILFYHMINGQWVNPTPSQIQSPQLIYDFTSAEQGWVITNQAILKTTDSGKHWNSLHADSVLQKAMSQGDAKELDIESDNAARLLVEKQDGSTVLLKTEDGGQNWEKVNQ